MPSPRVTPWRTGRRGRPHVPLAPQPMPLPRGGRPLKRWRWVGAFDDQVMVCAAAARVGPVPVWWWAAWDRETRTLAEHTVRRPGAVALEGSAVRIDDGSVRIDLAPGPVAIAEDLRSVAFATGEVLRFAPEAERRERERPLLVSSDYVRLFGPSPARCPAPRSP